MLTLSQVTGFTDLAPVVREQTVKAVLAVIGKLSDRTINGELVRYLAKTANDEQPGIRTNTTICLGKIAKNLSASVSLLLIISLASINFWTIVSAKDPCCRFLSLLERPVYSCTERWTSGSSSNIRPLLRRGLCCQSTTHHYPCAHRQGKVC